MSEGCMYCLKNDKLKGIMTYITELRESTLYLLNNQAYTGRCVLALNRHKREVFELSDQERDSFFQDLSDAAGVLQELYSPQKINYAVFGDLVDHFHFHVVPKYPENETWGRPFVKRPSSR